MEASKKGRGTKIRHIQTLIICLLVIPLIEGFGILSFELRGLFGFAARPVYWGFVVSIILLHWLGFLLILKTTRHETLSILSVKIDFFKKYKVHILTGLLLSFTLAYIAPDYLYSDNIPSESIVLRFLGPVTSLERIGFILLAITAGICEEVAFRGYGITVLERIFRNKKIALVLSSVAFMSLHGIAYLPAALLIQYFLVGIVLGWLFQKYRRLEILIIVHVVLDILVAVTVP